MPGSRDNKDCKLNAEDVRSVISDVGHALRDSPIGGALDYSRKERQWESKQERY